MLGESLKHGILGRFSWVSSDWIDDWMSPNGLSVKKCDADNVMIGLCVDNGVGGSTIDGSDPSGLGDILGT